MAVLPFLFTYRIKFGDSELMQRMLTRGNVTTVGGAVSSTSIIFQTSEKKKKE